MLPDSTPTALMHSGPAGDLADFDECECGDYRHQHVDKVGRCTMPNDLTHGFEACHRFRLSRAATQIPAPTNGWRAR